MKVVNICLLGAYTEGFTYQDNLLPKWQARNGHKVTVIAPTTAYGKDGALEQVDECDYVNADGVRVIRMDNDQMGPVTLRLKTYSKLGPLLERLAPDFIFQHGCQFRDAKTVRDYARSHSCVNLVVDNHVDFSNSATNWLSLNILHRLIWARYAKMLEPYAKVFWGVLPARVDFLVDVYGLSREKCDLLVMGADDEEVVRASSPSVRKATRDRLGFSEGDFVVVTGGKIDPAKTQTFLLMDAVRSMSSKTKLLMFGPIDPALRDEFGRRMEKGHIMYVPWASSSESYDYFAAADVICFPGRHSVYWEQAVAMGKPLIVRRWPGMEHVNVCNNALFLEEDSVEEMCEALASVENGSAADGRIFNNAKIASKEFMYSDIAKRSIGMEK